MYVSVNQASIGSDNGLLPICHQAIIQTNAGLLSTGPLAINFSEIYIKIQNFLFTKMHLNIFSAKWQPFCPREDELIWQAFHGPDPDWTATMASWPQGFTFPMGKKAIQEVLITWLWMSMAAGIKSKQVCRLLVDFCLWNLYCIVM